MSWPKNARKWSPEEIVKDAAESREEFRRRRFGEPMDQYLKAFDALEKANTKLIKDLPKLFQNPVDPVFIAELLSDDHMKIALRYLGAPPISEDDLITLVGGTLAWTLVVKDPERAASIRDVIVQILDPRRFPWVAAGRLPKRAEIDAAILASTVVASAQRVATSRRTDERKVLEGAVRGLLTGMGMTPVPVRKIKNLLADAPKPGEFTQRSCVLGEDDADILLTLYDHRVMAIECKGSNSELNSRKRINKEIAQNASAWYRSFGHESIVVAAAIQGVFKASYIEAAQSKGILFYWGHRLNDLKEFIESTKAKK